MQKSQWVGGRQAPSIFSHALIDADVKWAPTRFAATRLATVVLLVLCSTQAAVSLSLLYAVSTARIFHDAYVTAFAAVVLILCMLTACAGFGGACLKSRPLLLLFYINQLWSMCVVSTFLVITLADDSEADVACRLYAQGELSLQQIFDHGLDCAGRPRSRQYLRWALALLISHMLGGCFLCKMHSMHKFQDGEADLVRRGIVRFIGQHHHETYTKLSQFESTIQRQFEELRLSLHH